MTKKSKAARLRELIAQGCVMLPGVPNAAMARQVERTGFEAVYISGAGMANATAGLPDIGLLSMTEVVRLAGLQGVATTFEGLTVSRHAHFQRLKARIYTVRWALLKPCPDTNLSRNLRG